MRCHLCNEYIPENLGIEDCIKCGVKLKKNEKVTTEEVTSVVPREKSAEQNFKELTNEQRLVIQEHLDKSIKSLFKASLLWIFAIILIIIPIKFIPSRKAYKIQGVDGVQSFAEYFGFIPTLLFVLIGGLVFYIPTLIHSKFFSLRKDLKEKEGVTLVSKIIDIKELKGDSEREYNVFLEKNNTNIKKINFLISEFPNIRKGDTIKVILTKNAHLVLSTEIVDRSF